MDMTVDIILDSLQEVFSLQFFGKRTGPSFLLPVFYDNPAQRSRTFPTRFVCPESLLELMDYDSRSSVDYWGTLQCYLDNQMNIAETARNLFVHRNTRLRRIDRINAVFGDDLDDPEFRLWLAISMHLFDLENNGPWEDSRGRQG